jgi:hypothetical protein
LLNELLKYNSTLVDFQNFELQYNTPFLLTIKWEGVNYDFFVRLKSNSNKLIFFGNGAYDSEKMSLPVFQRYSWVTDIEDSVIIYNDPTLYLGKMNLGWGQGTAERFYLKELSIIMEKIISKLSIGISNVTFYGSSAGGFQSLYLAGLIKGSKALVNNPQTVIPQYYQSHVKKMYSMSYSGLEQNFIEEIYRERLDIGAFFKSINYIPEVLYIQNLACTHDVKFHLNPFWNELMDLKGDFNISRITFDFYYNLEQGHNPLDKVDTLKYLNGSRN